MPKVRDTRNKNWMWARRELVREHGKELGPYGVSVYMVLASYANGEQKAHPSFQSIADMLGCSRRKVIDAVNQLKKLGWVATEKRTEGKQQKSNEYLLLPCPVEGSAQDSPPSAQRSPTPVQDVHPPSARDAHEEEPYEEEPFEVEREGAPAREGSVGEQALQLYSRFYPKIRLNWYQEEQITGRVDDIDLWRKALMFWKSNDHIGKNVGNILDYCDELEVEQQSSAGRLGNMKTAQEIMEEDRRRRERKSKSA